MEVGDEVICCPRSIVYLCEALFAVLYPANVRILDRQITYIDFTDLCLELRQVDLINNLVTKLVL